MKRAFRLFLFRLLSPFSSPMLLPLLPFLIFLFLLLLFLLLPFLFILLLF